MDKSFEAELLTKYAEIISDKEVKKLTVEMQIDLRRQDFESERASALEGLQSAGNVAPWIAKRRDELEKEKSFLEALESSWWQRIKMFLKFSGKQFINDFTNGVFFYAGLCFKFLVFLFIFFHLRRPPLGKETL